MGEKLRRILPKVATSTSLLGSFTCRKFTTWDRRLYFPSEGRRAQDFFARKIRRLRPGLNPRTRVPKASTLTSRPPKPLYLRYSRPELLRRFTPPVMLHRIDWSIISAFRRAEGSSYSGVKQSKNTEQMHPYDKGTATVRNFDNNVYLQDYTAYYPIRLESSEKPF